MRAGSSNPDLVSAGRSQVERNSHGVLAQLMFQTFQIHYRSDLPDRAAARLHL